MKKLNKLVLVAATSIVVLGFQSCSKIFTTGELKGTWTLTSTDVSGESKDTYVNNTSNPNEILTSTVSYKETFNGGVTSGERTTENIYDGEGTGISITKTVEVETTTATGEMTIVTSYYSDDSTHIDTLNFVDINNEITTKKYTFENDGTFTAVWTTKNSGEVILYEDSMQKQTETFNDDEIISLNGTWSYLGKNKSDELKNNERIGIWYSKGSIESEDIQTSQTIDKNASDAFDYSVALQTLTIKNTSDNEFEGSSPNEVWQLISKSKGEMVVQFENNIDNSSSTSTYTDSSNPGTVNTSVLNSTSKSTGNSTFTKE